MAATNPIENFMSLSMELEFSQKIIAKLKNECGVGWAYRYHRMVVIQYLTSVLYKNSSPLKTILVLQGLRWRPGVF
jgi:hypothetical protein